MAIEDRFDRLCRDTQVLQNALDRSVKLPKTESGFNATLPRVVNGALIGYNETGDGLATRAGTSIAGDTQITATGSTTPRWLSDRAADVVNAKDHATLQAAINAAPVGGCVLVPFGTYAITEDITINKALTLLGAGKRQSIISRTAAGANTAAIKITASHVRIEKIGVVGPSSADYTDDENGIEAHGVSGGHLDDVAVVDCEVYNFGSGAILFEYVDGLQATNNDLHDCGYAGVRLESCTDGVVSKNRIHTMTPGSDGNAYGAYASQRTDADAHCERIVFAGNVVRDIPLWEALDTHGGTDISFTGNVIVGCKIGIVATASVDPTFTHQAKRVSIVGNTIYKGSAPTPGAGIIATGVSAAQRAESITIKGNVVDGMGGTGSTGAGAVIVQYINGLSLGGVIRDSVAIGLNIYDAVTDFVVSGLTIDGIQSGYASACGMMVGVGATACRGHIGDVVIDATAEYGIYFYSEQRGITWGKIKKITSNPIPVVGGNYAGEGFEFSTEATFNFSAIASGAYDWQEITVVGAELGDYAQVSTSIDLAKLNLSAYVQAANKVHFVLYNNTGGNVDLGPGDFTAKVTKVAR